MRSLFEVMRKRGEPIEGTPYVNGKEVDLYQLYQAVMLAGGSQAVSTPFGSHCREPDRVANEINSWPEQVMSQGMWHRIAAQLGWPVDASVAALRDAPPDTQRISLELARTYQKLLRPFEEVWTKSLLKQQQTLLENHRNGQQQQQQQFGGGTGAAASGPSATPLQPAAPPPLRPPSQNAQIGNNNGNATSLEASRQQLLQQAKAASLATQQMQASPAGQAKAQLPAVAPNVTSTTTPGTTSSSSKLNVDPTMEQMAEAKNMVSHIRQQIEASRRECPACLREKSRSRKRERVRLTQKYAVLIARLKVLEIPQDQRVAVAQITHDLIPAVRQVVETLPLFLAVTGDREAVRKMLTFVSVHI